MADDTLKAAQAVLDAFDCARDGEYIGHIWVVNESAMLAAALRAAVDQAIPLTKTPWGTTLIPVLTAQESRDRLLAIADKLDGP